MTLLMLLIFIVLLELIKLRPKPVRGVKIKVAELIPILIIVAIPASGLVLTILVILNL